MKIKAVCEKTGLSDRAIRLYIDSGLLAPDKTENYAGRRSFDFSEDDIRRLDQIAVLRAAGFSIAQIRELQTDPDSVMRIVGEVKEKQETELRHNQQVLSALNTLDRDVCSFDGLAAALANEQQTEPPAEDNRVRLRYLIARFIEGAYSSAANDGIVRIAILIALVIFGYYVRLDGESRYLFSANMWLDVAAVLIGAALAVLSAALTLRSDDPVDLLLKLLISNMIVAAAVGTMFLVWLIARIILYPVRPIPNDQTIHIAELWIGFILLSAVARVTLLILIYRRGTDK